MPITLNLTVRHNALDDDYYDTYAQKQMSSLSINKPQFDTLYVAVVGVCGFISICWYSEQLINMTNMMIFMIQIYINNCKPNCVCRTLHVDYIMQLTRLDLSTNLAFKQNPQDNFVKSVGKILP